MDKKRANAKQTRLLWVDLEMTGLDPVEDRILEVAAIVTDWNFTELASYEAAVAVGPRLVERRMLKGPAAKFWESVPETRDALIAQNDNDESIDESNDDSIESKCSELKSKPHGKFKITDEQLRSECKAGMTREDIAKKYNMHPKFTSHPKCTA